MPSIVLFEPEIPQNTGNISRTCAATGTPLHLIEPLGFELSDKYLKRAGLDYWKHLDLTVHKSFIAFLEKCAPEKLWALSTKGERLYTEAAFGKNDYLLFGRETSGLAPDMYDYLKDGLLRVPMLSHIRSLNLSNTVALVLFEALRQGGFNGLE